MRVEIPKVRVGEPQACGGVTAFPLFADHSLYPGLRPADEAMAAGTLIVQEASEAGEVPCLLADNGGNQSRAVRRGRGGSRRQAEPHPRFVRADRRAKSDSHPRRLRGTQAMGRLVAAPQVGTCCPPSCGTS